MYNALSSATWVLVFCLLTTQTAAAFSYTFYLEPAEGMQELTIKQTDISLERIYFDIPEQNRAFTVRVDRIGSEDEWVYEYFQINYTGMQSEPVSVLFDIRVNKSWVAEHNIDTSTIALSIFNKDWVRLETIPVSEDTAFLNYRVESPKLASLFALTGQPVPVDIQVSIFCNENDICEPEAGEDRENCPDCFPSVSSSRCVPSEEYCIDDNLLTCNEDGSDYILQRCEFGCIDDACLLTDPGPLAGMVVATNPWFILIVVVLLTVIVYLMALVKRMRQRVIKIETSKSYHEDVKALAKRRE